MDSLLMRGAEAAEVELVKSIFLFPPICRVVIGVRVTGGVTSSHPICLSTQTCPHTGVNISKVRKRAFVFPPGEKMAAVRAYK